MSKRSSLRQLAQDLLDQIEDVYVARDRWRTRALKAEREMAELRRQVETGTYDHHGVLISATDEEG